MLMVGFIHARTLYLMLTDRPIDRPPVVDPRTPRKVLGGSALPLVDLRQGAQPYSHIEVGKEEIEGRLR